MELSTARLVFVVGDVAGAALTAWIALHAWRNRDVPGALPLAGLALSVSVWAVSEGLALLVSEETLVSALLVVSTLADVQFAPLWVTFALAYTAVEGWRRPRYLLVLWLAPLGYVLLLVTAPFHAFADITVSFQTVAGVTAPTLSRGVAYWVYTSIAYLLLVAAYYRLVTYFMRSDAVSRKQTATIVGASLLPLVSDAVSVLGLSPHPGLDISPMLFALAGAIIGWALFKHDFLTVTPLASDVLVQELPDPVLVLDDDGRIVDHNRAAESALSAERLDGRDIDDASPTLRERLDDDRILSGLGAENTDGGYSAFKPQTREITDRNGRLRGKLVVLRDVTVQQRRLDRVEALQATTEQFIEARIDDEVADVAVSFVERILGQDVATVFLAEGDRLRPAAISGTVTEAIDGRPPSPGSDGALWTRFERRASELVDVSECSWPPLSELPAVDRVFVLSLGDHGLLCIGSSGAGEYTPEDRQFANILAGATATALDRVTRESELRENRRVVRQRTKQLEFLNGVLRHNIRNGMQVIDSNADLVGRYLDEDSEGHRHLGRIRDRSQELATLTDTIRSITTTLTAEEGERLRSVALESALGNAADTVLTEHDDVDIERHGASGERVIANELLEDVIESVLRNAVEHNDVDRTRIDIRIRTAGDWVQVHVADNGPGVSDHFKESLFERDIAISQTAHGFGLYFVAVMMDLYGGDVWYEDNDPRGAIAVLEFQAAGESDAG